MGKYGDNLDVELQQRAVEYCAIFSKHDDMRYEFLTVHDHASVSCNSCDILAGTLVPNVHSTCLDVWVWWLSLVIHVHCTCMGGHTFVHCTCIYHIVCIISQ